MSIISKIFWVLFVVLFANEILGQCANNNTFLADLTPAYSGDTVESTCITAGEYITVSVSAGNIYVFSTCGQNGFNTQMTLRNASGMVWYAYNDNFCGQQSQITWAASFTGVVRVLIDESPSCGSNTTCQRIFVTQQCQADAGTITIEKNGSSTNSPIYLCEGKDTLQLTSNNDYTLPIADSGEIAELAYMVFSCLPSHSNPLLDSCYTGTIFAEKDFTDANPGNLSTGGRYFLLPVTIDDGNNGGNPNGQVSLDNNGDSCYAVGTPIEAVYLSPIAFASNLDCANKAVLVSIFGGKPEYDTSNYTIVNKGSGNISGLPVSHGQTITIGGLNNGDFYSFDVIDNNGCASTFSGGPLSIPDAGDDTTFSICSTVGSLDLDTMINGNHDTTGKWYDPMNIIRSGVFSVGSSIEGTWKYVVDGFSVCSNDTSFLTISVDSLRDGGMNSSNYICQFDSLQNLWIRLSAGSDTGGTWFVNNTSSIVPNGTLNYGTSLIPSRRYKYVVNIGTACPRDSSYHWLYMNKFPNAGRDTAITLCSNEAMQNMTSLLPGLPDTNGTWFDPTNTATGKLFDPSTDTVGSYLYQVYGLAPCPDTSAILNISISPAPDPGIGGVFNFCRNDTTFNIDTLLTGNPKAGGIWISPSADTLISSVIDPSNAVNGNYIYYLEGNTFCSDTFSTVTLSFIIPPNPGKDDTLLICSSQPSVNLFGLISPASDAGGNWKDPYGNAFNGSFQPGIDSSGIYTYHVNAISPCIDSSSRHLVSVIQAPNPGKDTSFAFCSNDNAENLFLNLSGNPDSGGQWYDPFSNTFSMPFDPSIHIEGVYAYKVSGTAPCADSSISVNVRVENPPDPGIGTTLLFCSTDSARNLLSELGGSPDSNGSWLDSIGNPFSGTFYPSINASGIYEYKVNGISPCPDSSAFIQVTIFSALNPGVNSTIDLCSNENPQQLISFLGGNPDTVGVWKNPSGMQISGSINPSSDASGVYKYVISGIGTCSDTSSNVAINIVGAPNPGTGDTLVYCTNDDPVNLFGELLNNPDSNGTWFNPNSVQINGTFTPSSDTSGVYRYVVPGSAPCPDSTAYFLISKNDFANAGTNGSIDVCESDSAFLLFDELSGNPQPNGTWRRQNLSTFSGVFDPQADSSSVFSYTVSGIPPCQDSTAYVQVSVIKNVNAGTDTVAVFCNNMSPINLYSFLGGTPDPGGNWKKPNQTGFNGILDPAADSNGFYSYTIAGQSPCLDKTSFVKVTINTFYQAGSDATLTICEGDPPFNFLDILAGNPDIYGRWLDPNGNLFDGMSSSIALIDGKYKYHIYNVAPCVEDSSFVELVIQKAPKAGTGKSKVLCDIDQPVQLASLLTNNPDSNGLWFDPNGNPFGGLFDPTTHLEGLYTYVVNGAPPCQSDSAMVSLFVTPQPDAGKDQSFKICWNRQENLYEMLDSTSDINGIWLNSNKSQMNGSFDPKIDSSGKYYYVAPGNNYCPGDTISVDIDVIHSFAIFAGPDIYLRIGETKKLKASSFEAISFNWKPRYGLSEPDKLATMVKAEQSTEYVVTGVDQFGCENSDSVNVTVLPQLFIPNTFTPNNDGINDRWFIENLSEYPDWTLYIVTEDNMPVFETTNPYDSWDGTFQGKPAPQGNYIYILEFDSKNEFNDVRGKIVLLR